VRARLVAGAQGVVEDVHAARAGHALDQRDDLGEVRVGQPVLSKKSATSVGVDQHEAIAVERGARGDRPGVADRHPVRLERAGIAALEVVGAVGLVDRRDAVSTL